MINLLRIIVLIWALFFKKPQRSLAQTRCSGNKIWMIACGLLLLSTVSSCCSNTAGPAEQQEKEEIDWSGEPTCPWDDPCWGATLPRDSREPEQPQVREVFETFEHGNITLLSEPWLVTVPTSLFAYCCTVPSSITLEQDFFLGSRNQANEMLIFGWALRESRRRGIAFQLWDSAAYFCRQVTPLSVCLSSCVCARARE